MTNKTKLGLQYKGSKRRFADKIIEFILDKHPNTKWVYDLFGGGASFSLAAAKHSQIQQVFYNDIDTSIVNLLKTLQKGYVPDECYQFIDRNTFKEQLRQTTWFSGFVRTCFSFGGDCMTYIYGKDKEHIKQIIHKILVGKDKSAFVQLKQMFPNFNITDEIFTKPSAKERRLYLSKCARKTVSPNLSHYELLLFTRIQHLTSVEKLEEIAESQCIKILTILNKSYDEVKIDTPIEETVIYLDPPYRDTKKYKHNIDYDDKFIDFIKQSPYPIYVSGYDFPELTEVWSKNHFTSFSASGNNKTTERLYTK